MFGRRRKGRPSKREEFAAFNATTRFYAAASPKPDALARAEEICAARDAILPKKREIRRPVDGKPIAPSEYQEQGAVIDWWLQTHQFYGLPLIALYSVPNGAYLASGYAGASMLKKTGMRPGAPDLVLDVARTPYHGLRIEMKSLNGRERDEQREFGAYLESAGYRFRFCYGGEAAIAEIKAYLA